MKPDLVLTQSQCEVCAVSLADVELALCQCVDSHPRIVSLQPDGLAEIWQGVEEVAQALDVAERGAALVDDLRRRLDNIAARASCATHHPTVACVEWIEPLMAAGNWVPELVSIAGGENLFGAAGKHSPWMEWEDLVRRDPEVIVILPCGWDMSRSRSEMGPLTGRSEWTQLSAVRKGHVYLTDGNRYFNRPGPRVVESAEILAEILHPEVFRFGHEGVGWERWA